MVLFKNLPRWREDNIFPYERYEISLSKIVNHCAAIQQEKDVPQGVALGHVQLVKKLPKFPHL